VSAARDQVLAFRRVAARHEAAVKRIVARAVSKGRRAMSRTAVRRAANNPGRLLLALAPFADGYAAGLLPLEDPIILAFMAGWRHAERWFPGGSVNILALPQRGQPDPVVEEAIAWGEQFTAEQIVDLTGETRQGVRELTARVMTDQIPAAQATRLILDQSTLGLDRRRMAGLLSFRARAARAAPGAVLQAGGRRYLVPETGMRVERLDEWTGDYASTLLLGRSDTIARTVSVAGASAGQLAAWLAAQADGLLGGGQRKRWESLLLPCVICRDLNGQTVPLHEPFTSKYVGVVTYPPVHPNCRCSVVLVDG